MSAPPPPPPPSPTGAASPEATGTWTAGDKKDIPPVGRVPGIRSSPALRTRPLWLLVSFHQGPYKAAFHIPRRPSKSQWIKLKQQRFTWAPRQAVQIAWANRQERTGGGGCAARPQEGGLRAGTGLPRCQSITYTEGRSGGLISPLLI